MSINTPLNIKRGLLWNSLSQFITQGISLLSMMILGRLLSPADFGILGMFTIFIAIANMITDSGMGGSLIKKADVTIIDYSTLFIYNLVVSLILYAILYFIAPVIADFYDKPILILLIRAVGLVIIIHAFGIVQNIRILKELKFKALAIINAISGLISLIVAVVFAQKGFGIWALVMQQLSMATATTLLFIIYNKFIPSFMFSITSFKEQFTFGINLLLANLLRTLTNNIMSNVMAKITSLNQTGYFVQSNKLTGTTNQTITVIVDRSVFPVFAKIQDVSEMKQAYIKLRKNVFAILFPLCVLLALLSEPILFILFGSKWVGAAWILKILSFSLIPLLIQMLCRNILKSRANTKQIFFNEIVKSVLLIISVIISAFLGIEYMIWGIVVSQTIACLWIMYSVSKEMKYSYWQHFSSTSVLISISLMSYLFSSIILGYIIDYSYITSIVLGILLIFIFVCLFSFLFNQKEIFNIIRNCVKLTKLKNR